MEHIRTWEVEDFRLDVWDIDKIDRHGKSVLRYAFYHKNEPIFRGEDFACSPMHVIDSDQCVASLLSFLALREGDTDADYFIRYTARQIEWRDEFAEELQLLVMELEEA